MTPAAPYVSLQVPSRQGLFPVAAFEDQPTSIQNQHRKASTTSTTQLLISNNQRKYSNVIETSNALSPLNISSATMKGPVFDHHGRVPTERNVAHSEPLTATPSLHVPSYGDHSERVSTGRRSSNFNRPLRVSTASCRSNVDICVKNPRKHSIVSIISSFSRKTSIASIYSSASAFSDHPRMDEDDSVCKYA